ncbi:MAG: ABC transporter permease, partial [candidate division NC10 bacterium]
VILSLGLSGLGILIATFMTSQQGFQLLIQLLIFPLIFLAGVFFPVNNVPVWLEVISKVNPLTYGMAAIRRCLYLGSPAAAGAIPALGPSLAITVLFGLLAFVAATGAARRCAT